MNKNRYQQIMNRIQMPERCEQAILEQIAHNASPVPTRRTWKRNVIAGVAIAACISVIGMVSVSAIQGTNWIHQLFPNSNRTICIATSRKYFCFFCRSGRFGCRTDCRLCR